MGSHDEGNDQVPPSQCEIVQESFCICSKQEIVVRSSKNPAQAYCLLELLGIASGNSIDRRNSHDIGKHTLWLCFKRLDYVFEIGLSLE